MSVELDKSSEKVVFIAPSCNSKVVVDEKEFLDMLNDLILKGSAHALRGKGSVLLKRIKEKVSVNINITRQGSPYENYDPNDPPTPGGTTVISHNALPFEVEYQELEKIRKLIVDSKVIT